MLPNAGRTAKLKYLNIDANIFAQYRQIGEVCFLAKWNQVYRIVVDTSLPGLGGQDLGIG